MAEQKSKLIRGCGVRKEGGLYLTVPTSEYGKEIEELLIDPTITFGGTHFRAPMITQPTGQESKDVIISIGEQFYPFVPDFVEEARRFGISRRIPLSFDASVLTPYESQLYLIHGKAVPGFHFIITDMNCPKKHESHTLLYNLDTRGYEKCIDALWPLSTKYSIQSKHEIVEIDEETATIKTPWGKYQTNSVVLDDSDHIYSRGMFMKLPMFNFEFINSRANAIPKVVKEHIVDAGFEVTVCKE